MAHTSSAWKKACAGSKWDTTQRWSEWAGFSHRLTEYYLYIFTIFYFIAQTLSEVGVLKASVACLGNEDCAGPDTATLVLAVEHSDQQAAPSYRRWHHSGLNIKEELNLKSLLPGKKTTLDPISTSEYRASQSPSLSGDQDTTLVSSSPLCLWIILEGNQEFPPFPLDRERILTWLLSGQGSTTKSVCPLYRTTTVSFAWTEHRIKSFSFT